MIKKIKVINFKSFKEIEVELGRFNVLVGANASGKSGFVNIFKFLRDITTFGLDNAISMQGGIEYLRNINIGISRDLSIKIVFNTDMSLMHRTKDGLMGIKPYETTYEFALKFSKKGSGFRIIKDELIQKCKFYKLKKLKRKIKQQEIGEGRVFISRNNGKIKTDIRLPKGISLKKDEIKDEIFPPLLQEKIPQAHTLLIQTPLFIPSILPLFREIREISIYDFDPKLSKKSTPITGKAELEEDGNNLSIILKNILEKKKKKRKLFNLIKELLPFIRNIGVEKFADKSLLFKLQETYFKNQYLPASLISDGTINITAQLIALFFEEKPLIIIEEPERNIHPYLISKLVDMMKDASKKKQIIITTHNPEIVKHAGLENLLLIYRDEIGFSRISRPANKKSVKVFLKNDIGIDELYVQNLLE